ncbi:hypothetical protein DSO57_1020903 [Entomophthora muscae]|uniref:Uncharacterized protein n=2 Tax=Entomophthora muscae TaxID=34485 RepID=A0ACC2TR69_9FUNG|nr:hypothetical protein DSO57_1014832 [Entomophthora muscae]KAJ9077007.1 hypothetical protein DSO57_1020903 [Entomophthora muscae]
MKSIVCTLLTLAGASAQYVPIYDPYYPGYPAYYPGYYPGYTTYYPPYTTVPGYPYGYPSYYPIYYRGLNGTQVPAPQNGQPEKLPQPIQDKEVLIKEN